MSSIQERNQKARATGVGWGDVAPEPRDDLAGEAREADASAECDPTAEDVWRALFFTTHGLARELDTYIASREFTAKLSRPRMGILLIVEETGGIRMGDLAARIGITPRTVTTLVDALEKEGLLARQPDPTDRRATILTLTPAAEDQFERFREVQRDLGAVLERRLDARQRRQLIELLAALRGGQDDVGSLCHEERTPAFPHHLAHDGGAQPKRSRASGAVS